VLSTLKDKILLHIFLSILWLMCKIKSRDVKYKTLSRKLLMNMNTWHFICGVTHDCLYVYWHSDINSIRRCLKKMGWKTAGLTHKMDSWMERDLWIIIYWCKDCQQPCKVSWSKSECESSYKLTQNRAFQHYDMVLQGQQTRSANKG